MTYMCGIKQEHINGFLGNYTTSTGQDFKKSPFIIIFSSCNSHFPWKFDQSLSNATRCAPAWYKKQKGLN